MHDCIFQQDNCSIHIAQSTMEFSKFLEVMSSVSLDLNIVENARSMSSNLEYDGPQHRNVKLDNRVEKAVMDTMDIKLSRSDQLVVFDAMSVRIARIIEQKVIPYYTKLFLVFLNALPKHFDA